MKLILLPILFTLNLSCLEGRLKSMVDIDAKDYQELKQRCNENDCCEASVDSMKKSKGFALIKKASCPKTHRRNILKCQGSYEWCEPLP